MGCGDGAFEGSVEIVGLRQGERLREELLMEEEKLLPSEHEKVLIVQNRHFDAHEFRRQLDELRNVVANRNSLRK